ncbi:MAG: Response regulator receiver modulated metal dependent phosphohydrolase [Chloroflexi bacterium]|nr:MAG: Response regulator receiver modulated metal dependent phosphohydrolase [Chloroflexota bacterium]
MTQYVENYTHPFRQRGAAIIAKTAEKLTGLSNLSHFLVGTDTVEHIIERTSGYILDLLHIDICRIIMLDQNGHYQCQHADPKLSRIIEDSFLRIARSETNQRPNSLDQSLSPEEKTALGLAEKDCHWIIPLNVEKTAVGILLLGKRNSHYEDAFSSDIFYLVNLIADQLVNALHRKQLNEQLANSSIETVLALSKTLETRDSYSGSHSKRMTLFSEQIAQCYGFSIRETRDLCWAALLHDIGKVGIEDQILHKPGPLTFREWDIMKSHTEIGAQIVKGLNGLERIAPLILSHHERIDGAGYPHGLRGEEILLGARIIAVVDSYAAMTEGRIYRSPRTHDEAVLELKTFSGKMYDPEVVRTFIGLFDNETT